MTRTFLTAIKLILLVLALALAGFLAFGQGKRAIAPDQKIVFVVDSNKTMNTKDVFSGTQKISRLQAIKSIIQKTISSASQFSYGLVLFNASTDYIIPPTFDTGTFLLYLSGITTNLLPDGIKDFSQLSGLVDDAYTSYIVLSDFDTLLQKNVKLPHGTTLLGVGSVKGDTVRYANGIRYYDSGTAVFSARNDHYARFFHLPYATLTTIDSFSYQKLLFHGSALPLSQRISLYTLLGILVVLLVFL